MKMVRKNRQHHDRQNSKRSMVSLDITENMMHSITHLRQENRQAVCLIQQSDYVIIGIDSGRYSPDADTGMDTTNILLQDESTHLFFHGLNNR